MPFCNACPPNIRLLLQERGGVQDPCPSHCPGDRRKLLIFAVKASKAMADNEEKKKQNEEEEDKNKEEGNKEEQEQGQGEQRTENPIDSEKVAENPHLLPYGHHVGSASIKPVDKSKVKGKAVAAMQEQTGQQLGQIKKQMQTLAQQASEIQKRVEISEKIYDADTSFEPQIGHTYYLYERKEGEYVLSMIGPDDWGKSMPFKEYLAAVRLLADHTWKVLDNEDDIDDMSFGGEEGDA